MTLEEQYAFLDEQRRQLREQLGVLREAPGAVPPEILERTISAIEQTVSALHPPEVPSSISTPASSLSTRIAKNITSLAALNVGDLRLIHRDLTDDQPWANGGQLRLVNAWIGSGDHASYVPPPPDEIAAQIEAVLAKWRDEYPSLADSDQSRVVAALARLHYGICAVHPFLDANGRLARAVLDHAAQQLLGRCVGPALAAEHHAYYESLQAANGGDFAQLERLIAGALVDA